MQADETWRHFQRQFRFQLFSSSRSEHDRGRHLRVRSNSVADDQHRVLTFPCDSDLGYARGPFGPGTNTCDNDGFQFHLSQLRGRGKYNRPYDSGANNAYRITGQPADIQQWNLVMEVWGNNFLYATVEISRMNDGSRDFVNQSAGQLPVGGNMLIYPTLDLPLQFVISRTSCRYEFEYGKANTDGKRWFKFNSEDAGYEPHPDTKTDKPDGQYCWTTDLPNDPRGPARKIQCVFPAW